jgi:hypothetical protein
MNVSQNSEVEICFFCAICGGLPIWQMIFSLRKISVDHAFSGYAVKRCASRHQITTKHWQRISLSAFDFVLQYLLGLLSIIQCLRAE